MIFLNSRTLLSVVFLLSFNVLQAQAQTPQAPTAGASINIAILDMASIRRNAEVVKSVLSQLQGYRDDFTDKFKKEDAALKAANQELAKKRTLLSPEAFSQERQDFEKKVISMQQMIQSSKQALEIVNEKAMFEVDKVLNSIIEGIAEERGLNLILRRDVTILISRKLDITEDVIKQLNAKLPKVKVEKPVIK